MNCPPPLAERWLRSVLPPGTVAASILGDLQQGFEDQCATSGSLRAQLGYWRSAAELIVRYGPRQRPLRRSPRGRSGTPPPSLPILPPEELMASLRNDIRHALRVSLRSPLHSTIAVLTIALGVGLTVFTFSQVYGASIRGLPVPDADALVGIRQVRGRGDMLSRSSSPLHDYYDYRAARGLSGLAAYYQGSANIASDGAPPERLQAVFATANVLDVVGVAPLLGRTPTDDEDAPASAAVAVLGYRHWQSRFAGDPAIVGRTIRLNGEQAEVIGVMPRGFRFPFDNDIWVNARFDPDATARGEGVFVDMVGRLAPGASLESAEAELESIHANITERFPEMQQDVRPTLMPFAQMYMPPEIDAAMYTMMAAVLGVLLIACANVANLMLARASLRLREVAVRAALGASRLRVMRLLLIESLIVAIAGGGLGLAGAYVGLARYARYIEPIQKPYWIDIRIDGAALVFTLLVVLGTALLAGVVPALRASGGGANAVLRDESRGASSMRLGRFSRVLVVGEIAVSAALLVSAGLLVKSVINLNRAELGFDPRGIVSGRVALFDADYPERTDREQFFNDLIAHIREEPGVQSATLGSSLPGSESDIWSLGIEGVAYDSDADYPRVAGVIAGTEYFATFGVATLQGREFLPSDSSPSSEPTAIVNASFARRYMADGLVIGRRIRLGRSGSTNPWMRIVGVVPDLHIAGGVGGIGSDQIPREQVYLAASVFDVRFLRVAVRTERDFDQIVPRLRAAVAELDPNLPLHDLVSAEQMMKRHTWAFEMFGGLFATLGLAALFLAAGGLYGVMSFTVARRTRELGIRMALGAESRGILALVLRGALWQLGMGLSIGLALGALLSRPLAVLTYQVRPGDPAIFVAIGVTLLVSGVLATLVPARRALRVDPAEALRAD